MYKYSFVEKICMREVETEQAARHKTLDAKMIFDDLVVIHSYLPTSPYFNTSLPIIFEIYIKGKC